MRSSKKKLSVKYKTTMAQIAMIAGLGMMCLSSSVGAALMMGGGEKDGGAGAGGTDSQDYEPDPPPPPKYETYPDHDFTGGDIACTNGVDESDDCEAKCDADDRCVSYIHTANDKICCTKFGTQNYTHMPSRQITGYIKNIDGYEVKEVGDRPAGDIENMNPGTLPTCKARCDELDNCIGFNFNNNNCFMKKAEGISQTYSVNGYQFYTKI
jgi:hypothetical protein